MILLNILVEDMVSISSPDIHPVGIKRKQTTPPSMRPSPNTKTPFFQPKATRPTNP